MHSQPTQGESHSHGRPATMHYFTQLVHYFTQLLHSFTPLVHYVTQLVLFFTHFGRHTLRRRLLFSWLTLSLDASLSRLLPGPLPAPPPPPGPYKCWERESGSELRGVGGAYGEYGLGEDGRLVGVLEGYGGLPGASERGVRGDWYMPVLCGACLCIAVCACGSVWQAAPGLPGAAPGSGGRAGGVSERECVCEGRVRR